MTHETTLTRTVAAGLNAKNLLLVVAGSAVIAIAAQISVPMFPVPMTLQTLAITLIGLTFGARMAGVTLLLYLAEGAFGLPVFANGGAGLLKLAGPTAGFIWGFVAMAFLTGWLAKRGPSRGVVKLLLAAIVPAALLYVPGVLWLATVTGMDMATAFTVGAMPFLLGDLLKSGLAALMVSGGNSMLKRLR